MSEGLKKIDEFKRNLLKEGLSQCTEAQVKMFNRMYGSVEEIPDEKIPWAIQQIERTIEENKKAGADDPAKARGEVATSG